MIDTTNCDMAAEGAARGGKTDLEMENVHLRRKLMEAEDKSMRVAGRAALIIRERDDLSDEVQGLLREKADLMGRAGLSERERRILDMWPRFEDGEPVMVGDEAMSNKRERFTVKRIEIRHRKWMLNDSVTDGHYLNAKSGERVKRPAPEVVDENGVPFRIGDKVYDCMGNELTVKEVNFDDDEEFPEHVVWCGECMHGCKLVHTPDSLTHARPDSWELLGEDANKDAVDYWGCDGLSCDACPAMIDGQTPNDWYGCGLCETAEKLDIIRRAKKLAGVE